MCRRYDAELCATTDDAEEDALGKRNMDDLRRFGLIDDCYFFKGLWEYTTLVAGAGAHTDTHNAHTHPYTHGARN